MHFSRQKWSHIWLELALRCTHCARERRRRSNSGLAAPPALAAAGSKTPQCEGRKGSTGGGESSPAVVYFTSWCSSPLLFGGALHRRFFPPYT